MRIAPNTHRKLWTKGNALRRTNDREEERADGPQFVSPDWTTHRCCLLLAYFYSRRRVFSSDEKISSGGAHVSPYFPDCTIALRRFPHRAHLSHNKIFFLHIYLVGFVWYSLISSLVCLCLWFGRTQSGLYFGVKKYIAIWVFCSLRYEPSDGNVRVRMLAKWRMPSSRRRPLGHGRKRMQATAAHQSIPKMHMGCDVRRVVIEPRDIQDIA